jgi:hypothetical protein
MPPVDDLRASTFPLATISTSRRFSSQAFWLVLLLAVTGPFAFAQELREQPTPFSVWLDFKSLSKSKPRKTSGLPIWLESVERLAVVGDRALVRVRLRRMGALTDELQFRLFFVDKPGASPVITGWTETGSQPYSTEPLGEGLGVETSETVIIRATDLDYVDIEVPGNGSNLRGAFVTSLRRSQVLHGLDFEAPDLLFDPFGAPSRTEAPEGDTRLFGRIRATIDSAPLTIDSRTDGMGTYEFSLESRPLIAAISFEVLGATPLEPLHAYINDAYLGTVSVAFPDLADPGFRGASAPMERDLRFRYAGWLKAQVIIPGSRLAEGLNKFILRVTNSNSAGSIVVRTVEIQLKYPSSTFDYDLHP